MLSCVLDRRVLLELQHDGPHPGHVLGLLARLGVEVAQLGHAVPLGARRDVVDVGHELLLALAVGRLRLGQLLIVLPVPAITKSAAMPILPHKNLNLDPIL